MPKLMASARLSSWTPNSLSVRVMRATRPSLTSHTAEMMISHAARAISRGVDAVAEMCMLNMAHITLPRVNMLGRIYFARLRSMTPCLLLRSFV